MGEKLDPEASFLLLRVGSPIRDYTGASYEITGEERYRRCSALSVKGGPTIYVVQDVLETPGQPVEAIERFYVRADQIPDQHGRLLSPFTPIDQLHQHLATALGPRLNLFRGFEGSANSVYFGVTPDGQHPEIRIEQSARYYDSAGSFRSELVSSEAKK